MYRCICIHIFMHASYGKAHCAVSISTTDGELTVSSKEACTTIDLQTIVIVLSQQYQLRRWSTLQWGDEYCLLILLQLMTHLEHSLGLKTWHSQSHRTNMTNHCLIFRWAATHQSIHITHAGQGPTRAPDAATLRIRHVWQRGIGGHGTRRRAALR